MLKIAVVLAMLALSGCAGAADRIESRLADGADIIFGQIPTIKTKIAVLQTRLDKLMCVDFQWMKRYATESDSNQAEIEAACDVEFVKTKAVVKGG